MADVNEIVAGRTAQHKNFSFADRARTSQQIKSMFGLAPGWEFLTDSQKEALEMIAHKIARIIAGNPEHVDNWADIAGYAVLIQKELEGAPVDGPTQDPEPSKIVTAAIPVASKIETVAAPVPAAPSAPRPVVPPVVPVVPPTPVIVPPVAPKG